MFLSKIKRVRSSGAGADKTPAVPKKKRLEDTIRVVDHLTHAGAISIDGSSPLAYPFWRYKDADREFHVEKYRVWFWDRMNMGVDVVVDAVEQLILKWQEDKCLYLSHDKPLLPNHSRIISEFICFELRRRGLANDFS